MGTSISGLIFKNNSLFALNEQFKTLRPLIKEATTKDIHDTFVSMIVKNCDRQWVTSGSYDLMKAADEVYGEFAAEYHNVITGRFSSMADYLISVMIYPHDNKLYGVLFCDNSVLKTLFDNHIEYDEYIYYDHSDQPDHITDKEWQERKDTWGDVLGDGYYSSNGFKSELTYSPYYYMLPNVHQLDFSMVSSETRKHDLAYDQILTEKYKSSQYGGVFAAVNAMRSPEAELEVKQLAETIDLPTIVPPVVDHIKYL